MSPVGTDLPTYTHNLRVSLTTKWSCFPLQVFFCALRQTVASWQHCIGHNTTSGGLPVGNLCRAKVWGEKPPPLAKNIQLIHFNESNMSQLSHHHDTCTSLPSQPFPYCCSPALMGATKRCNSGQNTDHKSRQHSQLRTAVARQMLCQKTCRRVPQTQLETQHYRSILTEKVHNYGAATCQGHLSFSMTDESEHPAPSRKNCAHLKNAPSAATTCSFGIKPRSSLRLACVQKKKTFSWP